MHFLRVSLARGAPPPKCRPREGRMHFGSGAPLGAHLRNRAWEGKSEGGRPRGHFGNKCARRVHLQINERHLHESATCDLEVSSLKLEPTELKRRWVAETARGTTRLPLPGIRNIQRHNPNTNIDHARTRTWNLRLRRPTPYPLGHATTHTRPSNSHHSLRDGGTRGVCIVRVA